MSKISIIMPSFNHERFIARAIGSVLSQQGDFQLELIVVDGGSTDSTAEILKGYGDAIRWVSEPDDGQADALNKGLAMAGGDIIGWLNSDDVYEAGALSAVVDVFDAEGDTQWLYGKVRVIDSEDREIRRWITDYKNCRMRRFSQGRLLEENWISQMGVFWRRGAGEQVGEFRKDLHYCMDYNYWLRLGRRWEGRFVDRYLAAFRWYTTSKSGAGFTEQFCEQLAVAKDSAAGEYRWRIFKHRINIIKIVLAYSVMRAFRKLTGG